MNKYIYISITIIILSSFWLSNTNAQTAEELINYPREKHVLPEILQEISGLTVYNSTSIACVQDELGIIFIYDFLKKKIVEKIQFAAEGDYEGIAKVDDKIYVLRSDAKLFEATIKNFKLNEIKIYETGVLAKNNEALCHDKENNRLLIGSKVKSGKESDNDLRQIFSFNLKTKKTEKKPAFTLNKNNIVDFAKKNNIELPKKYNKKLNKYKLNFKLGISGVSIHPKTKDMYVLCAIDYVLLIYSKNGILKNIIPLNNKKHAQAEGITFLDNGNLLISNEGKKGQPLLYIIKKDLD